MILKLSRKVNLATIVFAIGALLIAIYFFISLLPISDNAVVVKKSTPIASLVSGRVQAIYVENGQYVKKGTPILQIESDGYQIDYERLNAQHQQVTLNLAILKEEAKLNQSNLTLAKNKLAQLQSQHKQRKQMINVNSSLSMAESLTLAIKTQQDLIADLKAQLKIGETQFKQAEESAIALKAAIKNAQLNLAETMLLAPNDGYVQGIYISVGAVIMAHQKLFMLLDDTNTYIEAYFDETALTNVKPGDQVLIFPRAYIGHKLFHGTIILDDMLVTSQVKDIASNHSLASNRNWFNLSQKIPLLIKVTDDKDAKYPLLSGMSSYIYIKK